MNKDEWLFVVACCAVTFLAGVLVGSTVGEAIMHTEKRGCEYVEQSPCKQVWIKE